MRSFETLTEVRLGSKNHESGLSAEKVTCGQDKRRKCCGSRGGLRSCLILLKEFKAPENHLTEALSQHRHLDAIDRKCYDCGGMLAYDELVAYSFKLD